MMVGFSSRRIVLSAMILTVLAVPARPATLGASSSPTSQATPSNDGMVADFNGNGFSDLAVSAIFEDFQDVQDAGAVHILYGSPTGLAAAGTQFWTEDMIGGSMQAQALFGEELQAGDLNGDGYADLAIGVMGADIENVQDAGALYVLYGGPDGLTTDGSQFWTEDMVGESLQAGAIFAEDLASGDWNGDGYDDLAIGAPGEDVGDMADAGIAYVLYGGPEGLTSAGSQAFCMDESCSGPEVEAGDKFGEEFAAADYNGDGFDDLVVGAYREDVGDVRDAGAIVVLFGSATGLSHEGSQYWTQDSPNIRGIARAGDWFGMSLAAGDFDGDGFGDAAVGAPRDQVHGIRAAGSVNVLYGSATGLTAVDNQFLSQGAMASARNQFAGSLTVEDMNNDGFDDLAIGVPYQGQVELLRVGAVYVTYGSPTGLDPATSQIWSQDSPGVLDRCEWGDAFGWDLGTGDYSGDGFADLMVSAVGEGLGSGTRGAGAVNILYGSPSGIISANDQFWNQDSPGIPDEAEEGDAFGLQ